jgi:hypothetical protein
MGLFDRLLGSRSSEVKISGQSEPAKAKKAEEAFFLDPDASTSMGDVNFMRRSNTIRRTFPGTAANPAGGERVEEVASMESRLEKMSPGLGGSVKVEEEINLTGGVPKPVKKTFAEQMSKAELDQRMKGSAVAVNAPGVAPAALRKPQEGSDPSASSSGEAKPGAIDPFKSMARDLNA